ncbi:MAG TPA: BACON domain-containing carbohydrate-binding protein, partial [Pyrinomonadaceae bacterium]
LSANSQNFPANGSNSNFNVLTNAGCTWTAQANDNWITITGGNQGNGNGTVSFTVAANTGPARTGTITAAGLTYTVNQASGCAYSLSATSANFPAAGGNGSVNVTTASGCAWTAASNVNWISITGGASGSGNGSVTFNVLANPGPERTGTLTIAGQTYTVTQASGCTFSIAPTGTTIAAAGGAGSFNVTPSNSACGWTAATTASWISITSGSGTGNGSVSFTVQANPGPQRTGSITVGGQTFTITQTGGCSYSLSSNSANFPSNGGTGNFNINTAASCQWTAVSNVSWITITGGASGTGNGTISFSVQANTGPERSGTITAGGETFTVNQASGCVFTLPVNSANVSFVAGTGSFTINSAAGCQWTATSNVSWLTITSGSSGSGNGTVGFSYQSNPGVARTGTITAGGQTFTVTQARGCQFQISPLSQNFASGGGTGSYNVIASDSSCPWNAASTNLPWLTVTNGSGTGSGTVTYSVAPNQGPARVGNIVGPIGPFNTALTFTVNQAGAVVNRKFFDYDGDGRADLSVFRPSTGSWYISRSSDNGFVGVQFGANGDLIAPADFDGDMITDICVFRPSDGGWYRLNSSNNTFTPAQFGTNGDLPVPGDFDGDGRADLTVYRPSAGSWYRINSSNNQFVAAQFGIAEDKPLVGDFDGDGKSDLTVFRPSNGTWYRINSATDTFSPAQFGAPGDLPVAADYDGDGKTDLAVYRPSVGDWYIINSSNNSFTGLHFGVTEDKPAPADFDGDGKADLVVFRPSSGTWYLLRTTAGFTGFQFGASGDVPTPNAFVR